MDSRPCATASPLCTSGLTKYAALLAGLERSCRVAPGTDSRSIPHTESREHCGSAASTHTAESPASLLALSSSDATDLLSVSTSFASYSPLTAQRRRKAAGVPSSTPSMPFELRIHQRRGKGVHGGTRHGCEAFAQNARLVDPYASVSPTLSINSPALATDRRSNDSYLPLAALAPWPGKAQCPRGAGNDAGEGGLATRSSRTSDDYLHYYLTYYGRRILAKSSSPNTRNPRSSAEREAPRNGEGSANSTAMLASDQCDSREALASTESSIVGSCAVPRAFVSIPGCSPIRAGGEDAFVGAVGYSDEAGTSSLNVVCRLIFTPVTSPIPP
ncbi:hypothetical protein JKF63_01049 [Porcisia hertigi]|uniref:Uncharacterized protein n=1 Tax=Porcisia hertigi TaxID=2761500 RepID=A0A836KZ29_9TRYP|nr:hypothetical protein JKF63_01049 [Porcisia hertigi]